MNKQIMLSVIIAWALVSCSVDKYGDVKKTYQKVIKLHDAMAASIENAETAEEIAAALNAFTSEMLRIQPDLLNIIKKYPELKDKETIPEDLKPLMEKVEKSGEKASLAMIKVLKYQHYPVVKTALSKLNKFLDPSA